MLWTSGDSNNNSPHYPHGELQQYLVADRRVKSEPRLPEWGCQCCPWLSVGMEWGTLAGREIREASFIMFVSFLHTVHGSYVYKFDQILRLYVPCFLADFWTEVNQNKCARRQPVLLMLFKSDIVKLCPLPVYAMWSKTGMCIKITDSRVFPLWWCEFQKKMALNNSLGVQTLTIDINKTRLLKMV